MRDKFRFASRKEYEAALVRMIRESIEDKEWDDEAGYEDLVDEFVDFCAQDS